MEYSRGLYVGRNSDTLCRNRYVHNALVVLWHLAYGVSDLGVVLLRLPFACLLMLEFVSLSFIMRISVDFSRLPTTLLRLRLSFLSRRSIK